MNDCGTDLAGKSSVLDMTEQAGEVLLDKLIPADGLRQGWKRWVPMRCLIEASALAA